MSSIVSTIAAFGYSDAASDREAARGGRTGTGVADELLRCRAIADPATCRREGEVRRRGK